MRALFCLLALPLMAAAPAPEPSHKPAPAAEPSHKPAAAAPATAAPAKAEGPKATGRFEDWTAATNTEGGQTVCYAFTRASRSTPAVPGRRDVVLTVTQRPGGRDSVALSAGFTYPANATVAVTAGKTALEFYTGALTNGSSAFARDGHAAVAAFNRAGVITARSPGPRNTAVTDTFSLNGFSKAYDAISKACPPK